MPKSVTKTVFIVGDDSVFSERLAQLINEEMDLAVCGVARKVGDALAAISDLKPDLVTVDISSLAKDDLRVIKELRAGSGRTKMLVVSMRDDPTYVSRVIRAGSDGYAVKEKDQEEIVFAIRDLLAGKLYISEEILVPKSKARGRQGEELGNKQSSAVGANVPAPRHSKLIRSGQKRILLVDDEPTFRGLIKQVLALDGHSVIEAVDAAQALSLFSKRPYDLVVTDFEMPKMKGDELVNAIRRLVPCQRIIAVSANWGRSPDSLPIVDGYLSKPFLVKDLRAMVRRVLRKA